ncbi:MAG: helix-turn-helix domain-containing protein [Phycisphaerae bacterium]|nr:helix-turn-helix domain-containing protein [Phycisphaerae bacterium]
MEIHKILHAVRCNVGLTQIQVSERTGIDDSTLSAIEKGHREPKLGHLSKLSEVYHTPLSILLGERPMSSQLVMWRSKPENAKEIEAEFLELCGQYHHLEVCTSHDSNQNLPKLDSPSARFGYPEAIDLAEATRGHFSLGYRSGESLLFVLEEVYKVKVFHLDLGPAGIAACAYSSTFGPAILMNKNVCRWRRNHDIAHELFHLLTWERFNHDGEICEPTSMEEKLATCFAGNLLLPETLVRTSIDKARDEQGRISFSNLDAIARQFDVSLVSLVWRMHFLYKQNEETTKANEQKAREYVETAPREDGPFPSKYPERYRALAIEALQDGQISIGKFSKYMSMSRREARRFISSREQEYAETETELAAT